MTPEPTPLVTVLPCDEALADRIRPIVMQGFRDRLSANQVTDMIVEEVATAIRALSNKGGRDGE